MPSTQGSLSERVASSYNELSSAASVLNAVSDELGKSILELDAALRKLNLGISFWTRFQGADPAAEDSSYWSEDIGYAKISGKWGIGLRTVAGDMNRDDEVIEEWPFNDAPRSLRLSAVDKIPELLEKLSKEAVKTTDKIRGKLAGVREVAAAVKLASLNLGGSRGEQKK